MSAGLVALADRIELWPIDRLRPYERNPRTHSDAQVDQIAASMVEFGWTNPILIDGNAGILAGHGRLLAARRLGLAEVPVIRFEHLSEAQESRLTGPRGRGLAGREAARPPAPARRRRPPSPPWVEPRAGRSPARRPRRSCAAEPLRYVARRHCMPAASAAADLSPEGTHEGSGLKTTGAPADGRPRAREFRERLPGAAASRCQ
jgi:hypothetical protein